MLKKYILLLLLPAGVLAAEGEAIEKSNFDITGAYQNSSIFKSYTLSGSAHLPISKNIGASITALYRDSDGRRHGNTYGIGAESTAVFASLFMRDPNMGRLSILYAFSSSKSESTNRPDRTTEADTFSLAGEYYVRQFTLSATRSYVNTDANYDQYSTQLMAAWYIMDNTSIAVIRSRISQENSYSTIVTHQPSFLNDNMSMSVGYNSSSQGGTLDSIMVSMSYFFGTRVSLIDRDRKYR